MALVYFSLTDIYMSIQ